MDIKNAAVAFRGSRPPRGGRGLKFAKLRILAYRVKVAPLAGGVD